MGQVLFAQRSQSVAVVGGWWSRRRARKQTASQFLTVSTNVN